MKQEGRTHFGLISLFIGILFLTGLINSGVTAMVVYLLVRGGILVFASEVVPDVGRLMVMSMVFSIPIGLILALTASMFSLKPVRNLIDGMDRLASGDFGTRVNAGSIMRRYPAFVAVTESFNKMAQELERTEMLRSDFVNNFSHEFKTPIVSIAGLAKVLKRGNLTQAQREEYISAIEEESMRLSSMATNVLSLTKVENQTILTDISEYNLSEQIRFCVLLLENKWSRKNIEYQLEFEEYNISASEELMKQVWINLLDNAVKFTPEGHTIQVRIARKERSIVVDVINTGSQIPRESLDKIFYKFYQADESHATQGNGVGLAIVKRIVQLHGGKVCASSENDVTDFTVELPN